MIPVEYFLLRKRLLEKLLQEMPCVTEVMHRGKHVYRYYSPRSKKYTEIGERSKSWDDAAKYCELRNRLKVRLSATNKIIQNDYRYANKSGNYSIIKMKSKMDSKYYDELIDCSCDYDNNTLYYYNGRHYRSRAEMEIAVILDELGLEFKYDVNVKLDGVSHTIDFVICFREFDRCIFLEYWGLCNDRGYVERNSIKVRHAVNDGIYIGRDLFILSGNDIYTPSIPVLRSAIKEMIEMLCLYHIKVES